MKLGKTGYDELERRVWRALWRTVFGITSLVALGCLAAPFVSGPAFVCGINANESAAIATLKNIHSAQTMFRDRCAVDRDGDTKGEFGWLDELAGTAWLRGSEPGRQLDPPLLSKAFGAVQLGNVQRSGYLFCLWLPAIGGGWARECDSVTIDADAAETQFCIYAWPSDEGLHRRAFFLTEAGDVFASRNAPGYRGTERPVLIDAAFPSSDASAEHAEGGHTGRDGEVWVVVG